MQRCSLFWRACQSSTVLLIFANSVASTRVSLPSFSSAINEGLVVELSKSVHESNKGLYTLKKFATLLLGIVR